MASVKLLKLTDVNNSSNPWCHWSLMLEGKCVFYCCVAWCITDVQGVGTFPFRLFIVHTEDTALTGFDAPTQNNLYGCWGKTVIDER